MSLMGRADPCARFCVHGECKVIYDNGVPTSGECLCTQLRNYFFILLTFDSQVPLVSLAQIVVIQQRIDLVLPGVLSTGVLRRFT